MILLTGATGTVGSALLRLLTSAGEPVRCLVRDPRRLGADRVRVQIALGDLSQPASFRNALRGVSRVVHLAASIRDQPGVSIEELNAVATQRLLRASEAAGVERFVFFSALGASEHSAARFLRAKALAERAVRESPLDATVFAPSIVYTPGDPWLTLLHRFSYLPVMPVSGAGRAAFQPIWAGDVAACVLAVLSDREGDESRRRLELAGPETLTYSQIVATALRSFGRPRRLLHLPLSVVRPSLRALGWAVGPSVFATWDEVQLLELSMTTERGMAPAESLGVSPKTMAAVLGAG